MIIKAKIVQIYDSKSLPGKQRQTVHMVQLHIVGMPWQLLPHYKPQEPPAKKLQPEPKISQVTQSQKEKAQY